jgi:hypothetical protein
LWTQDLAGILFQSRAGVKKLQVSAARHESKEIITINRTKRQSMPIYNETIESLDGRVYMFRKI